jgi:uncharacterized protein (DUF1501 family)
LKLDDHVGLHPSLKELHSLWESGDLAVLQGVGYPNPNRSHTRSMEIWQTGVVEAAPPAGWLGRVADVNSTFRVCHVGPESVPMAVRGRTSIPQALASLSDYQLVANAGLSTGPQGDQAGDPLVGDIRQRLISARELAARLAALPAGPSGSQFASVPETLEGRLATIHRLTDHGAAAPVFVAGRPVQGTLFGPPPNLAELDDGGDPRFTTDFRDIYATLLRGWLAVDPDAILGLREVSLSLF